MIIPCEEIVTIEEETIMGKFVVKKTATGIKFDLKAGNGQKIGTSEVFTTKAACLNSIASVQKNAPDAPVEDTTVEGYKEEKNPKFVIYLDNSGKPRFKLNARNGENILACGESFESKNSVLKSIESVKKNAADSAIVEEE